ncbi:MAG: LysR family transcriptional regulator [Coriobacteriales bacterium]
MKIEYLEYLVDFSKTHSVSATAKHFYLSAQGMSRALHQVEKESGYVLFDNEGGYLRLTRAGQLFVEHAMSIVDAKRDLDQSMHALTSQSSQSRNYVRLYATPAATRYLLPILDLQSPGMFPFDVLLREENLRVCAESISTCATKNCLSLVSFPLVDRYLSVVREFESQDLIFEPLIKSSVIALVSTSSVLSKNESFSIDKDLVGLKVGYLQDDMLIDVIDDYVRDEDIVTVTSNLSILEDQVSASHIVTFMVQLFTALHQLPTGICSLPCEGTPEVMFGLLYPANSTLETQKSQDGNCAASNDQSGSGAKLEEPEIDSNISSINILRNKIRNVIAHNETSPRFAGLYTCVNPK